MQTEELKGVKFDPGFGPHILAFNGSVTYLYTDINRFKNLSQKKMKFRMYYKKMLDVFYNNIGFYTGCLMWAAYIKNEPKQKILSNPCLGQEYNEEQNIADIDYAIEFAILFPKDMKYFLGQDFNFGNGIIKILETYKEFLILNKGFVNSEYNTDIILPNNVKTENLEEYKTKIDEAIKKKQLQNLTAEIPTVLGE